MSMSFEQVVSKLEGQLVWLGPMAPGMLAHRQAWQLIEQLWAKLLAITPRSEETRMRLENIRVAKENAERGSVLSKQQILSGFLKTKVGRLAFEDFKDGKLGRFVSVTGKGKEQMEEEEKREREKGRKKVVEVEYNVNNCEIKERKGKEPNMVEQSKLINQKATSFALRIEEVA